MKVRAAALALVLVGCGGATAPALDPLEGILEAASTSAPSEVAQAREARGRAELARRRGDALAAADEDAIARAWADAALTRAELERERAEADRLAAERTTSELAEARRLAAEQSAQVRTAADAARAATRVELVRALQVAEADEAQPRRARRVSLADPRERARAARAIAEHARLLLVAVESLGGPDETLREQLGQLEVESDVERADAAYRAVRRALGMRRAASGVEPARASWVEALESEGFEVVDSTLGTGAMLDANTPASRCSRLGGLLASYPIGEVLVVGAWSGRAPSRCLSALRLALGERAIRPIAGPEDARRLVLLPAYGAAGVHDDEPSSHPPSVAGAEPVTSE